MIMLTITKQNQPVATAADDINSAKIRDANYQFHDPDIPRRQELKASQCQIGQCTVLFISPSQFSLCCDNLHSIDNR